MDHHRTLTLYLAESSDFAHVLSSSCSRGCGTSENLVIPAR